MRSVVLLLLLFISQVGNASHIIGGEITYSISGLHVRITITCYSDHAGVTFGNGTLAFGDGESIVLGVNDWNKQALPENTNIQENYLMIEHTYTSTGLFEISYTAHNRNAGILNINYGSSVSTAFYIESAVLIDPSIRINNSPVLHNALIDKAAVQQKFTHNPWSTDSDGDSLSFVLAVPKQDKDSPVPNYRFPGDNSFDGLTEDSSSSAKFAINPYTGHLSWNSPNLAGEYNIAFKVLEWRKIDNAWIKIGTITRDMQVIVEAINNERPEVYVPDDTLISIGTSYRLPISYEDAAGDSVTVQVFSELIENGAATIDYSVAKGENTIYFEWTPGEKEKRTLPYTIFVKVTDNPPENNKLATYKAFRVGYNRNSLRVADDGTVTGYEKITAFGLRLYPNPSSDKIRLEGIGHRSSKVLIANPQGKYLLHCLWPKEMSYMDIDVSTFPTGVYILILKNKDKVLQYKILVE